MDPESSFKQTAFSVAQVAVRWGVSCRHIYDLCARGELGHLRIGGLIRVRLADLEAYEASQWHAPKTNDQAIGSRNEETGSTSGSGKTVPISAFQRGKQSAVLRKSG
jgi:excisionase family DNA binding protein